MKSEKFTLTNLIRFDKFIKMSFLAAMLTLWGTSLNAQCPLACNNLVQVSMDADCTVEITPDMMLQGNGLPASCSYVVQVLGADGQPIASSPSVTSAYVGQTLTVKVWLGTNSCWGSIKIEDKLPPVIDCPAPITITCYNPMTFPNPTATDNCGGAVTVSKLSDVTTELDCTDDNRAVRVITYQAKDASGNLSTVCSRTITYSRITLADIRFPKNYDGTAGNRPVLGCDGGYDWNPAGVNNWDTNGNKYPDPAETGAPYVRDNANIKNIINGYRVSSTPTSFGVANLFGCFANNIVGNERASSSVKNASGANSTWRVVCDGAGGTTAPIDTVYNEFMGNNTLCKINTTFSDTRIDICAKSFKVLRQWTVLDWCSGNISQKYQIIKVEDNEGPIATIPSDPDITVAPCAPNFTISSIITADPYTCTGSWVAFAPINVFDCSETSKITYTVSFALADAFGNPPPSTGPYYFSKDGTTSTLITSGVNAGKWQLAGLPFGCSWLKYTLTDECGNSTDAFTEIRVVDKTPPVAVCDEHTVVTLSNNGWAHVFAETFDDGSHDNCSAALTYEVRRTTSGCSASTTTWGPYVQICCDDVGKTVFVELRVTDSYGNSNTCTVEVTAQDKVRPVILTCPANDTINCTADVVFGLPTFSDNCSATINTPPTTGSVDNCGVGSFSKTWTVTDKGGLTATCSQTITVINNSPYNGPSSWPASPYEVNGCMNVDTDPAKTGIPNLGNPSCSQVAYTYEDQVFPFVDGVCFKILRKWTVIDWCKFNGSFPSVPTLNINMWQYTQVIKVSEDQKPVIQTCSKAVTDVFGDNCNGFVSLTNSATDCTPAAQLSWKYTIDPNDDGVAPFITGSTNDASGTYPVGTHRITWTVEDMCGNQASCAYTFVVKDAKKPTPYCISDITTVVMPSTGEVSIWATDFNLGSFDNCPGALRYSFSTNVNQTSLTFTCSDLGENEVRMYVWDAAGNFDYCTVTINIQANGTACSGARIAGNVGTEDNEMVKDVQVTLQNMSNNETKAFMTNSQGQFEFSGMPELVNYKVTPEKDINHLNGVSTLDLVLMQRHILGLEPFNSGYKYLAGDVNKDNKVSAADLVELRKLILGIYSKFPNNKSWRFVDKAIAINDITNPWSTNDYININNFNSSMMSNNFVAVKVGDINSSATTNANSPAVESRNQKTLSFVTSDQSFVANDLVNLDITSDNFDKVIGAQWTLNFDAKAIQFNNIKSGALQLSADNVNTQLADNGQLAFSWNDFNSKSFKSDEVLFTIEFRAASNNKLSNTMSISSDITKAEAYTHDLSELNIALSFRSNNTEGFSLDQNNPNPFTASTVINFTLPQAGVASLKIYDITGKVVKSITNTYPKGINSVVITSEDVSTHGVLFYELESNGSKATKKMIYLNK